MSRELSTFLIDTFSTDSVIEPLIGKDASGLPCIFPLHTFETEEIPPYPHITVARFGSMQSVGIFDEQQTLAADMDDPRMAVCCWSQTSVDAAYQLAKRIDILLRGNISSPAISIANQYFSSFRLRRTHFRDDLFDTEAKAFHIHAEYGIWLQLTGTPQPF